MANGEIERPQGILLLTSRYHSSPLGSTMLAQEFAKKRRAFALRLGRTNSASLLLCERQPRQRFRVLALHRRELIWIEPQRLHDGRSNLPRFHLIVERRGF